MKIIVFDKINDLHKYVANLFIEQISSKPNSVLGFATGTSPLDFYKLLIEDYKQNNRDWSQIKSFNLDEFVNVDPSHNESFINQMNQNLFNYVNIKKENIFIPNGIASNLEQEALNYENMIAKNKIDLQYISLGINGHIAYNEPKTDISSKTHISNLEKATIDDLIAKQKFSSYESAPKQAITMGVSTILNHTKKIIMISFGQNKALVTKKMLEDKPNSDIPAAFLQLHPNCIFVLDKQAAKLLDQKTLKSAEFR
ncbi:glucosamine-6-phosphate deaminase [[Mycoplasma] collis]|uniref:glucosamine-6-phosphate deaminase n=1 Tax=[Mycoplasma] collis TaxID=2127 RepID=UPI00051AFA9A|nr:glucosamine-6-phosphate deaminase [[Mycoplasma] collis]